MKTPSNSNCAIAYRKLSDKRPFDDIRREHGYWQGLYDAVHAGDLPKPLVNPIKREIRA